MSRKNEKIKFQLQILLFLWQSTIREFIVKKGLLSLGINTYLNEELKGGCSYKFEDLPDVILLKAFSLLNVGDLCRAGRVCVRWYQLTRSPILWKWVDAQDMQLTSYQVQKLIPILPPCVMYLRIRSIAIQQRIPFLTPQVAIEMRERCPQLRTLIIESAFVAKHVHFTDITVEDLPQKLTVLSLRKSFFHADQFFCSVSHPTVPKINVLDCSSCWCVKDYDIPFFMRLSDLQEIYLSGCPISDMGASMLLNAASNLKVIDLEATFVGDDTLILLAEQCKFLEKLYLGNTKITDYPLCLLLSTSLPKLSVLCLAMTAVSANGLRAAILNIRTLKSLYIGTNINPDTAIELSCLLPSKRNIIIKNLNCNVTYVNSAYYCLSDSSEYCDHFLDRTTENDE